MYARAGRTPVVAWRMKGRRIRLSVRRQKLWLREGAHGDSATVAKRGNALQVSIFTMRKCPLPTLKTMTKFARFF